MLKKKAAATTLTLLWSRQVQRWCSLEARCLIPLGAEPPSLAAAVVRGIRQRRDAQPGRPRFDLQRPGVQLVLVHQERRVQQVVGHPRLEVDLVRRLLKPADLLYHVRDLKATCHRFNDGMDDVP